MHKNTKNGIAKDIFLISKKYCTNKLDKEKNYIYNALKHYGTVQKRKYESTSRRLRKYDAI